MAYGLQVFNSSGQIRLDTTDRLTRFYGKYNSGNFSGPHGTAMTISVPGLVDDGFFVLAFRADLVSAKIVNGGILLRKQLDSLMNLNIIIYRI